MAIVKSRLLWIWALLKGRHFAWAEGRSHAREALPGSIPLQLAGRVCPSFCSSIRDSVPGMAALYDTRQTKHCFGCHDRERWRSGSARVTAMVLLFTGAFFMANSNSLKSDGLVKFARMWPAGPALFANYSLCHFQPQITLQGVFWTKLIYFLGLPKS